MNFKEEYVKAAEEFTPDRQTIDRMKVNVLRMTSKKAFPFRTVAVAGGTVAACAAITLAAVRIAPDMTRNTELVGNAVNSASSSAEGDMNGSADRFGADCAPEAAADSDGSHIGTTNADTAAIEDIYDVWGTAEAVCEDAPAMSDVKDTEHGSASGGGPLLSNPGFFPSWETEYAPETYDAEDGSLFETYPPAETCDWGITEEPNAAPVSVPSEIPDTGGGYTEDICDETLEYLNPAMGSDVPFFGYTLTLAEDRSECTLIGGGETLTYKRSTQTDTTAFDDDASILYVTLVNTTDNKDYYVALAYDTVIIKNEEFEIVGLFN